MLTKTRKEFRDFIIKKLALPEEYSQILADAAKYNTYVETLGNKADNLHLKIKEEYVETIHLTHSNYIKHLIKKQHFGLVDLICDITTDDFYGKVSGLHIHPWTGKDGVEGKFHYLVVGILVRNKIIPFYAIIIRLGCSKAKLIGKAISYCHSLGLKISKILLDRGFYSGEVIDEIKMKKVNYLIFVPKKSLFRYMLEGTDESVVVEHEIPYQKNFTKNIVQTNIALIKNVLDHDWVFATNISLRDIHKYVQVYRKRWNIETMFRVHDEAKIKTKSKEPVVRLFYFILGMLLVLLWNIYAKQKMTFKLFIIKLMENKKEVLVNIAG